MSVFLQTDPAWPTGKETFNSYFFVDPLLLTFLGLGLIIIVSFWLYRRRKK